MRNVPFNCLSLLAILFTVCLAANTTDVDSLSSSTETSSPASSQTTYSHSTHHHHIPFTPFFPHSFQFPSTSAPSTGPTSSPIAVPPSVQVHQSPTVYILIIVGGLLGLVLIALCTRQAITYTRSPRHNVAMTAAERQQLVQEIAGFAQMASRRQRESCWVSPPPPYERAPSYESSAPHQSF